MGLCVKVCLAGNIRGRKQDYYKNKKWVPERHDNREKWVVCDDTKEEGEDNKTYISLRNELLQCNANVDEGEKGKCIALHKEALR